MEIIAIIIAAVLGWQRATFGQKEAKAIAVIVVGWSAVTAAAMVPFLSLAYLISSLIMHAMAIVVPYGLAVAVRRLVDKR